MSIFINFDKVLWEGPAVLTLRCEFVTVTVAWSPKEILGSDGEVYRLSWLADPSTVTAWCWGNIYIKEKEGLERGSSR